MPRKHIKKTLGALSLCGALVVPAAASADGPAVGEQIRSADAALAKAEALVAHNQDAVAAVQMARANAETRVAAKAAAALARASEARAQRRVATQFNQNAETYAELTGDVVSKFQAQVAAMVEQAIVGRERALEELTGLLDRVPAEAVPGLTAAIAALASDPDIFDELSQGLEAGEIALQAEAAVQQALERIQSSMQRVLDLLDGVSSELPPVAQGYVQQVQDQIGSILDSIGGLLGGDQFGGGFPF